MPTTHTHSDSYQSAIQFAYSHCDLRWKVVLGALPLPGLTEQTTSSPTGTSSRSLWANGCPSCVCMRGRVCACDVSTGKGEVTGARGWSNNRRRWNAVRRRGEQLKRQQRLVKHTRVSSQTVSFAHTVSLPLTQTHTHIQTRTFLCDRQFHSVVAEVLAYKKQCWYDLMGESYYKTVAGHSVIWLALQGTALRHMHYNTPQQIILLCATLLL